jgi:hypothetical protein
MTRNCVIEELSVSLMNRPLTVFIGAMSAVWAVAAKICCNRDRVVEGKFALADSLVGVLFR